MINYLPDMKAEVQKQLDEKAGHDLRKYMENLHTIVRQAEKEYGITFRYGKMKIKKETAYIQTHPS